MRVQAHYDPKAVFLRHLPYHAIIIIYGLMVVTWMLQTHKYAFLGMYI